MQYQFVKSNQWKLAFENSEVLILVGSLKDWKASASLKNLPPAERSRLEAFIKKKNSDFKAGASFSLLGAKDSEADLYLFVTEEAPSAFELLVFARKVWTAGLKEATKSLSVYLMSGAATPLMAESLGAAFATRKFLMPVYGEKKKEQKSFQIKKVSLCSDKDLNAAFTYGYETGEGSNLVRSLGTIPANFLDPEIYGKKIKEWAKEYRLGVQFHSKADLQKLKAGAFLAVNQGDPDSKGGIYELTYRPKASKNKKPVALVGKGLCFDTGGYDIKTGGHMATMKGDMTGSAVALSTLLTAARLKLPVFLKAFLVLTENHISPKSYKADDVVTAMNGRSIEVVNTDAEGRMVLADALCLASRSKPQLMIDYATLTGMAVYAIGSNYSAAFTNEESLHAPIVEAGKKSGERVWTFPTDKDYEKVLKSPVADTLQCSRGRGVDHILGAVFLSHFVEKGIPWVHVDLSAADNKGGLAHTDSEFTGFGVRWSLEFLSTQLKLKRKSS
jgi:leucyl aminopeptidase